MAGFVLGVLQFFLGGKFYHPLSLILDYLLANMLLGVAGFFSQTKGKILAGTFFAALLRFLSLFLSGWIVFGEYAPAGKHPALYSLTYNGTYMIPETIIAMILVYLLYTPLKKALRI